MRFLTIGKLSGSVAEALKRHEHEAVTPEQAGIDPAADGPTIIRAAQKAQLEILTADAALAGAAHEHDLYFPRTIVFLQLAGGEVEQDDAVDRLFKRYRRLTPRRLYTVTETRVKIRQLPGSV